MKPFVIQARQQAYREIMQWGLLAIREAAYTGHVRVCEIEADHLHNLPSLLDEPNEMRRHCYIEQDRAYYLERLDQPGHAAYLEDRIRLYGGPWKVLEALAANDLAARAPAPGSNP